MMKVSGLKLIFIFSLLLGLLPAAATPTYLMMYEMSEKAKANQDCLLCHVHEEGGEEINKFGEAFVEAGYDTTEALIKAFPQNFKK